MPSFRSRRIDRVFWKLARATPPGARRPWKTLRGLALIGNLLDGGVSEGDLVDYVTGAAELVRRGREEPRWWSVQNLFGENNVEVWRANIAEMQESDEKAAAKRKADAQREEDYQREADAAPAPSVVNLSLRKAFIAATEAQQERWDAEEDSAREA